MELIALPFLKLMQRDATPVVLTEKRLMTTYKAHYYILSTLGEPGPELIKGGFRISQERMNIREKTAVYGKDLS